MIYISMPTGKSIFRGVRSPTQLTMLRVPYLQQTKHMKVKTVSVVAELTVLALGPTFGTRLTTPPTRTNRKSEYRNGKRPP